MTPRRCTKDPRNWRWPLAFVMLTAALAAGLATPSGSGAQAGTTTLTCTSNADGSVTCPDPVNFRDTSQTAQNQFIVSDPSNAPQFSVGTGGAASWANPLCITNNPLTNPPLRFVACIGGTWGNGQGQPLVTLYDSLGKPHTLTAADIDWIHQHETASVIRWGRGRG